MLAAYLTYMVPRVGIVLLSVLFGLSLVACAAQFVGGQKAPNHFNPLPVGTRVEVVRGHFSGCRGKVLAQLEGARYLTRLTCTLQSEERLVHVEEIISSDFLDVL
jgi:hypothetical protein